jgi:uncharacterized protein
MNGIEFNGWELLKLVYTLRKVGLQVSIQEIQEVLITLNRFQNFEVQLVIRSIFIHRQEDNALFDLVWQLLFGEMQKEPDLTHSISTSNSSGLESQGADNSEPGHGAGTGNGNITIYSGLSNTKKALTQSPFEIPNVESFLLKGFPSAIDVMESPEEPDIEEQVKFILGQSGFLSLSNSKEIEYRNGRISEEEWNNFNEQRKLLEHRIRDQLWHLRIQKENCLDYLKKVNWRYKPLDRFTIQEDHAVHQALRQIGKKLAARSGWRKKKASHGTVRVSSALREMVRGNGLIYRLEYQKPLMQKPELIVLCDVSNSVAPYSQFLLYLIQRIKSRFRRVKIYLFIDTIWDISTESWVEDKNSIEQINSWAHKKSSGFTDYGKVFKEFFSRYLAEISSRATLLILGDARNNYRASQAEYIKAIQERIRHVYWLNPLEENEWLKPDNIMREYIPYCSKAFRCRTIDDLWRIAREIF